MKSISPAWLALCRFARHFFDHKLVEFCARVPSGLNMKIQTEISKAGIARQIAVEILKWGRTQASGIRLGDGCAMTFELRPETLFCRQNSCISNLFWTGKVRMMLDEHAARNTTDRFKYGACWC